MKLILMKDEKREYQRLDYDGLAGPPEVVVIADRVFIHDDEGPNVSVIDGNPVYIQIESVLLVKDVGDFRMALPSKQIIDALTAKCDELAAENKRLKAAP